MQVVAQDFYTVREMTNAAVTLSRAYTNTPLWKLNSSKLSRLSSFNVSYSDVIAGISHCFGEDVVASVTSSPVIASCLLSAVKTPNSYERNTAPAPSVNEAAVLEILQEEHLQVVVAVAVLIVVVIVVAVVVML